MFKKREYLAIPIFGNSIKIMVLGGGELGKEIAIEGSEAGGRSRCG